MAKFSVMNIEYQKTRILHYVFCFSYGLPTFPFEPKMNGRNNIPYDPVSYTSSFVLQDMSNYQQQSEFNGEL